MREKGVAPSWWNYALSYVLRIGCQLGKQARQTSASRDVSLAGSPGVMEPSADMCVASPDLHTLTLPLHCYTTCTA